MPFFFTGRGAIALLPAVLLGVHCSSGGPNSSGSPIENVDAGASVADAPGVDTPPKLPPAESSFIDVPAQSTSFRSASRIFYSFQPTLSVDNKPQPLLVFFNGGPAAATSTCLMSYGTGPFTLDTPGAGEDLPHANPRTFARFANLLYIDARNAGFSYNFRTTQNDIGDCREFMVEDAIDFLRVLFRFLINQPGLRHSRVVLVAESYGGARALTMAHLLLHYDDPSVPIPDDLRSEIRGHFDTFWPEAAGGTHTMAAIGREFARLVLIQPFVGAMQYPAQRPLLESDPYLNAFGPGRSNYDVRERAGWEVRMDQRAMMALSDEASSRALLGFDLALVRAIFPDERVNVVRPWATFDANAETLFRSRFGSLGRSDGYLASRGNFCTDDGISSPVLDSNEAIQWIPEVLRFSRLFLTNARYDRAIHTPGLFVLLDEIGLSTEVDREPRPGVDRPGWFRVKLPANANLEQTVEVRFPTYEDAGHMVTVRQGPDLADDVANWLSEAD